MQPLGVVEHEVVGQSLARLTNRFVGVEIDFFIFDRPPQPLDENVIENPAAAVHRYPNPLGLKSPGKIQTRELSALVAVEDFRPGYP